MIQSESLNYSTRCSGTLPFGKNLALTSLLGLVLFTSGCHFYSGAVSLVPAPNEKSTHQPGASTQVAESDQLQSKSQEVAQQPAATPQVVASDLSAHELIAADLVNAILQIDKLHPSRVTLQMSERPDDFSTTFKFVLEQAGYNFSSFSTDAQPTSIATKHRDLNARGNGMYRRYQIDIGDAKFRREYFIQPQGVTPSSDLMVKGVDSSLIVLNEAIFEKGVGASTRPIAEPDPQLNEASIIASPELPVPLQAPETAPVIPANNEMPALATAEAISPPTDFSPGHANQTKSEHPLFDRFKFKQNRYALGHSNFARLTENFIDIKSQVLIFGNDSLNLGRRNKATVLEFAEPFIEETDVIAIVGCSHGRTDIRNGNVVLATGRTQRVKEALLIAGIAEDRILDEGCWSATDDVPQAHPKRGVTVTLKRERRNG